MVVGSPMIIIKMKIMLDQKVMMVIMMKHLETLQVDLIDAEDLEGVMDPWDSCIRLHELTIPIFSAKDYEDAESHLLYSNDWVNTQGIAEESKCGRLCLTIYRDSSLNLAKHRKNCFEGEDYFNLMRHLTQLSPMF